MNVRERKSQKSTLDDINKFLIRYFALLLSTINILFSLYGLYSVSKHKDIFGVLLVLNAVVIGIGYVFVKYYSKDRLRTEIAYYFLLLYQYLLFYMNGNVFNSQDVFSPSKILFLFVSILLLIIFYRSYVSFYYTINKNRRYKRKKSNRILLWAGYYSLLLISLLLLYLSTLSISFLNMALLYLWILIFVIILFVLMIERNNRDYK